jgi:hypothetical protein
MHPGEASRQSRPIGITHAHKEDGMPWHIGS